MRCDGDASNIVEGDVGEEGRDLSAQNAELPVGFGLGRRHLGHEPVRSNSGTGRASSRLVDLASDAPCQLFRVSQSRHVEIRFITRHRLDSRTVSRQNSIHLTNRLPFGCVVSSRALRIPVLRFRDTAETDRGRLSAPGTSPGQTR